MNIIPFVVSNSNKHPYRRNLPNYRGWGEGFILILKDSPLYNCHFDDFVKHCNIHQGISYFEEEDINLIPYSEPIEGFPDVRKMVEPEGLVLGWSTQHSGDSPKNWSKEQVIAETLELFNQLKALNQKIEEGELINICSIYPYLPMGALTTKERLAALKNVVNSLGE